MSGAEGGAPAAAGKAEPPADVSGTPVPEAAGEAAEGPKGGGPEVSAGAVGWGPDVPEDGRVEEPVEPWEERHFGGADGGEDSGPEAAGVAEETGVGAPGTEAPAAAEGPGPPAEGVGAAGEAGAPVAEAAGPADEVAVPAGGDGAPVGEARSGVEEGVGGPGPEEAADSVVPGAEVAAPAVEGAASVPGGGEARAAVAQVVGRVQADAVPAGDGGAGNSGGRIPEGGGEAVAEPGGAVEGAGQNAGADGPDGSEAAFKAVMVGLTGVQEAVSDLAIEFGAVPEGLAEIKGKLDAAASAAGGKDAGSDWESIANGVSKAREDIVQLLELVRQHGEMLKQAGKGQGEKADGAFESQLREMMTAGLDRVAEQIAGLVEQGDKQAAAFEGVKLDVKVVKEVGASVGTLEERLQAYKKDLSRDRELVGGARRWVVLGLAAFAAPALVLAGAFVGQQWQVLPLQESTGGWKDHVWERYGLDLVECVKTGVRQGAPYDCTVDVGASVEQVRGAARR